MSSIGHQVLFGECFPHFGSHFSWFLGLCMQALGLLVVHWSFCRLTLLGIRLYKFSTSSSVLPCLWMSVCCLSPGLLVESPTCGLASLWHLLFIQIQQQVFCELDLTLCSLSVWSFLSSLANLVLCVGYLLPIRLYCIYLVDYLSFSVFTFSSTPHWPSLTSSAHLFGTLYIPLES